MRPVCTVREDPTWRRGLPGIGAIARPRAGVTRIFLGRAAVCDAEPEGAIGPVCGELEGVRNQPPSESRTVGGLLDPDVSLAVEAYAERAARMANLHTRTRDLRDPAVGMQVQPRHGADRAARSHPVAHHEDAVVEPAKLARMARPAGQALVSVVPGGEPEPVRGGGPRDVARASAARDAKRAPELALVEARDLDSVVRTRGATPGAQRVAGVAVHAGVHDHALTGERELEREQVAVGVSGVVVWTDRPGVADHVVPRRSCAIVARIAQREAALGRRRAERIARTRCDPERRVVQE